MEQVNMQNLFRWGIDGIDTVSRVFVFEAEYNLIKEKQL